MSAPVTAAKSRCNMRCSFEGLPPGIAALILGLAYDNFMPLQIRRIQAWCGEIPDRPGAAAGKLAYLNDAGAELEFLFTRPNPIKLDTSVLFVAPITGPEQMDAARKAGLGPALDVAMLVVEGETRPG